MLQSRYQPLTDLRMTAAPVSEADLELLWTLLEELGRAGLIEEGRALARAYAALQEIVYAELLDVPDDDPGLVAMVESAEQDVTEGRLIPHDEVLRRFQALSDA